MIKLDAVTKSYAGDLVLGNVSLLVNPGDRIGVVGPNGVGKSTLLRIVAQDEPPDSGTVLRSPDERVGYLRQEAFRPDLTVDEYLLATAGEVGALSQRLHSLERQLATAAPASADRLVQTYGEALARFEALGGWSLASRISRAADALHVETDDTGTQIGQLSGGEQARVMLAGVLLGDPTTLALDEPTNHLDIDGLLWLEQYIADFDGALLVVSHDRKFLDRVVERIVEFDGIEDEPNFYPGGYSDYVAERARRWQRLLLDYEVQEKFRRKLAADIERTKRQSQQTERSTTNDHARRLAKKVAKKAKARERRLERELQSARWIDQPEQRPQLRLGLGGRSEKGRLIARLDRVSVVLDGRTVVEDVGASIQGQDRIALFGPNGAGKSTLLRALVGTQPGTSGTVERFAEPAYLPQVQRELPLQHSVLQYFRGQVPLYEDDARNVLNQFLFDADQVMTPLRQLSPGERARAVLATMVAGDAEFLVLDEPTNHLDFDSLDRIEQALHGFAGTLLVVSHDRYFLRAVGCTRFWTIRDRTLAEVGPADVTWLSG